MAARMDVVIVVIYMLGMIAFGFWGKTRAKTQSDFLVAGRQDIVARLRHRDIEAGSEHDHIRNNRLYVFVFGIVMVIIACVLQDVVAALTVAYDILVGGLLVPILGGLIWRRGTNVGAVAAMAVGTVVTLATMIYLGDIYANDPIFFGLASGLVVFVVGSLATNPTDPEVLAEWDRRSRRHGAETVPTPVS